MNGTCGCCAPGASLTPIAIDNRPGLAAVAYRIGTYSSFREAMLEAIAQTPELAGLGTRRDDDYSITLLDLWAAVSDVLTFYTERYANEVFLRTAQQPESLRRLAGLIGYNPRPGIAALAQLAFTADPGKTIQVPVGLRVQSTPAQGQLPQTFETIEALTVDSRFNSLRIYPQPSPQNPLQSGSTDSTLARLQGPLFAANLAPNDQIVIFNQFGSTPAEEKKIKQTRVEDDRVIVTWTQPVQASTWNTSSAASKFRRKMQLFGFNQPDSWFHAQADSTVAGGIRWQFDSLAPEYVLLAGSTFALDSKYTDLATGTRLLFAVPLGGGAVSTIMRTVVGVAQVSNHLGSLSDTVTQVTLDGNVSACSDRRQVVVYELTGDSLSFADTLYGTSLNTGTVYLPGIIRDNAQGIEVGRTVQQSGFVPGVLIHPKDLAIGRKFILTDALNNTIQATLHSPPSIYPPGSSAGNFAHLVLTLDADAASLDTATSTLLGNVIEASHGETVQNEIIGSGDASQTFQSLALQRQPLTYIPGSGPNGAVSSLNVRVNGLLWQEVAGLYEQSAKAQVFSTSLSEAGSTAVQFGDSNVGGAVLPTGSSNVSATYRVGAGLARRVGNNALTTLLDRLQGLSGVNNPLSAEGGADPESLDMIRQNAPRTVRTFGRAVSLQDFEDLITASGEVAKAEAIWIWDGLSPAVYLTIAGQAGGTFADPWTMAATLNASRDPNRRLLIGNFQSVPIILSATVLVSPLSVQSDVLAAVLSALLQTLSFDALNLGQSIHLSGMYAVLQGVAGVTAVEIAKFGFRQPDGMSNADFNAYQDGRGVLRLSDGTVAPVQEHLRIFSARPNPASPGQVFPAELASIETPGQDISITAMGS
jgi:uncharacterized phage protein gp47/JayE